METGNNIKRIANILYTVAVIAAILMGIGALISIGIASDLGFGGFLLGLLAAGVEIALGVFAAWVIKTLITGFGELVENSEVIRENTEPKEKPQPSAGTLDSSSNKQYWAARQAETAARKAKTTQSEYGFKESVVPVSVGNGKIKCASCGTEQPDGRTKCCNCGAKFIEE